MRPPGPYAYVHLVGLIYNSVSDFFWWMANGGHWAGMEFLFCWLKMLLCVPSVTESICISLCHSTIFNYCTVEIHPSHFIFLLSIYRSHSSNETLICPFTKLFPRAFSQKDAAAHDCRQCNTKMVSAAETLSLCVLEGNCTVNILIYYKQVSAVVFSF